MATVAATQPPSPRPAHKRSRPPRRIAVACPRPADGRAVSSADTLEQAHLRQANSSAYAYFACPIHFEPSRSGRAQLALLNALLAVYAAANHLLRRQ